MTNKKRRSRGSRTHGGGTQKNRRGAGNRGGRGNAGRNKHEAGQHGPLGKHGFTRPPETQRTVEEVDVGWLDEEAPLLAADGAIEETEHGYRIDAREVVDDGFDADAVKVLGGGQVRRHLEVTADAFSAGAVEAIESSGGDAILSERARERDEEKESSDDEA